MAVNRDTAAASAQTKVYEQWFQLADEDRDGVITGAEAVRFFMRSGLDQATLGQVWELASNGAAKLNHAQFASALRLVALAQGHNGRLPLDIARGVMAGVGAAQPIPRMQGLEQLTVPTPGVPPPAQVPQTGAVVHGAFAPVGYPPQAPAGYYPPQPPAYPPQAPQAPGGYAPQFTGAGYVPQTTGATPGALPPATAVDLARYQAAFQQLDADRDGVVQGADCFTYFMQWGLDKAVLRHIWQLVAGDSASLQLPQLTSCLYLMDAAKRGVRPPVTLPPGPFPPVAHNWSLQSQFGGATGASAAPPTSQTAVVLPVFPVLPPRFAEQDQGAFPPPGSVPRTSQVPTVGATTTSTMAAAERERLAAELKDAAERESRLHAAEDKATELRARLAAFNAALQEVTVFKSRTDVAVLQAQDQAIRLEEELAATKAKYNTTHTAAAAQGKTAARLREHLGGLVAQKAEASGQLLQLEAEVAAANAVTPADVMRMEGEVAALRQQVANLESQRDAKTGALAGVRQQRAALEARTAEVRVALVAVDAEAGAAQKEVATLQSEVAAVRSGKGPVSATALGPLLSRAAQTYRTLCSSLVRAGEPVPYECLASNLGLATWVDDALTGAADWNVDDASRGYVLVNALPGQAVGKLVAAAQPVTTAVQATPPAAAPASHSKPADAFGEAPAFSSPAPAPVAPLPAAALAPSVAPAAAAEGFGDDAFGAARPATSSPAPAQAVPLPAATPSGGFEDNAF